MIVPFGLGRPRGKHTKSFSESSLKCKGKTAAHSWGRWGGKGEGGGGGG